MSEKPDFATALKALVQEYDFTDRKLKMDTLDEAYEELSNQRPTLSEAMKDLLTEYHDASDEDLLEARRILVEWIDSREFAKTHPVNDGKTGSERPAAEDGIEF